MSGWPRPGGAPVSKSRVQGSQEIAPLSQKPGPHTWACQPDSAKEAPPTGPSCLQDEYIWRLTQLLGSLPPSRGELLPSSSDSICTEDFAAHFQEAMVEPQEEAARTRSLESLGGHISRVSQASLPQPLSSRGDQQPPKEGGTAKCSSPSQDTSAAPPEAPSPRLGTAGGRSLPYLGGPFPDKCRHRRDAGLASAGRLSGGSGGPSPHPGHRRPRLPPPPPHHRRVRWAPEPARSLLPSDPAWESPALRQLSRPLAGTQDPRLCPGRLPTSPWDPESLLPVCPLGDRDLGSQKEEPSLSHRMGLKKEQEMPRGPKPWKWSKKPERLKDRGSGQLRVTGAPHTRPQVSQADSGTNARQQELRPKTPTNVEATRPGSPGSGLGLLRALIEAVRRRLWDVDRQAESLCEAIRELQRDRLRGSPGATAVARSSGGETSHPNPWFCTQPASVPDGSQGPEPVQWARNTMGMEERVSWCGDRGPPSPREREQLPENHGMSGTQRKPSLSNIKGIWNEGKDKLLSDEGESPDRGQGCYLGGLWAPELWEVETGVHRPPSAPGIPCPGGEAGVGPKKGPPFPSKVSRGLVSV
ncbi:uncharacterized protein LOC141501926 [Macrotis lagotis]|uniref:uncharacterized protein LOC141501926 n=1 Tax=Macrotis lagotis TaxID=92651 RepID=UPI003D687815